MLNLANLMKTSVLSGLLALGAAVAMAQPAAADDYGGWGSYCGDYGYYCNERYRDYDYGEHYYDPGRYGYYGDDYYGDDYGNWGDGDNWDNWDSDGYYGYPHWHMVCDSDGDRCYRSPGYDWDYRQYYRLHGYHWDN